MKKVSKEDIRRYRIGRTIISVLIATSCMLHTVCADRTDIAGLHGSDFDVHIKEKNNDVVTFDDISGMLAAVSNTAVTSLESIFANRVYLTNQLPTTDDAGASQSSNTNHSPSTADDGLSYGEWMDVDDGTLYAAGVKHSWAVMCYGLIKDESTNQYKYTRHPTQAFTDEYGFRKFRVDDHEYYCIAVATYFGLNGKYNNKSEFIKLIKSDSAVNAEYCSMAGHAVQVELEDGSIVPCVVGDVKAATDRLMADSLRGHWAGDSKSDICIIESVVDCYCTSRAHPTEDNWRKQAKDSGDSAGVEHHNGSPWTSDPVRIRMGPMLSIQE